MTARTTLAVVTTFATHPTFSDPADAPVLEFLGSPERLLVSGSQTGGEFALFSTTGHRGHASPWHVHRRASETFVVLDGEVLVDVDGQRHTAGAGHVAVLPRDLPHGFVVVSDSARYLTVHTPAGFDDFVHDASDAAAAGAPLDRDRLTALAVEHGIEILGPGLSIPTP
jgi:quercetin dioxygenase-like cupin family protein